MNNIDSAFRGSAGLTKDYYEALVTASMEPYRVAVRRAKARKDTLEVESAVYSDMDTKLSALYNSIKALRQDETDSVFDDKSVTVGDSSYISGTATSSAVDATYAIHVDQLAVQHRVWSDQQSSSFTLDLGGTGNTAKFKLRAGGTAADDLEITVNHGDSLTDISAAINTAVEAAIDAETLDEKNRFTASVVDNRLVLESNSTGTSYALVASDTSGTVLADLNLIAGAGDTDADANGFVDANETVAKKAQFTVNGISIERDNNTEIDDVITGVTFALKKAHGTGNSDTVSLTVSPNTNGVSSAISSFVSKLNDFNKWLSSKSGVTENKDGSYTRGVLASNYGVKGLRRNLIQETFATWNAAPANATYKRLDEVGLSLEEGLVVSLDSGKLGEALSQDYDGVVALFEGMMEKVQDLVEPYTEGTESQLDKFKSATQNAIDLQSDKIERLESSNERREEMIRNQIALQFASISRYNDQGRYLMTTMYNAFA